MREVEPFELDSLTISVLYVTLVAPTPKDSVRVRFTGFHEGMIMGGATPSVIVAHDSFNVADMPHEGGDLFIEPRELGC